MISRVVLLVVGTMLVAAAFGVDALGFGDAGSFGLGQVLLSLLGCALMLGGFLGKRFFGFYRDAAAIVTTSVVLLACLELAAIIVGRTSFRVSHAWIQELPYYQAQDWTETYWREASHAQRVRYVPYVGWKHLPFEGETVNFDRDGLRLTPGADCREGAFEVFAFGGSTMVGWGSPDWGTIPAYIQKGLAGRVDGPVCVVNHAQDGFVSTQSLIWLVSQLQNGNVPDVVLFYGGVNEVLAAAESGEPGAHVTLAEVASRFERRESPIITFVRRTRLYSMVSRMVKEENPLGLKMTYSPSDVAVGDLARAVAGVYVVNFDIAEVISELYDFEVYYFLQPHLGVGSKVLTTHEREMRERLEPAYAELAQLVYGNIDSAAQSRFGLHNLADVFDEERGQIWIDAAGHITPEGNQLVAKAIVEAIGLAHEGRGAGGQ